MSLESALKAKDSYRTLRTFGGHGVRPVFGSVNDIELKEDGDQQCCQASSAVWCSNAMKRHCNINTLKDAGSKVRVKNVKYEFERGNRHFDFDDKTPHQLEELLRLVSLSWYHNVVNATLENVVREIVGPGDCNARNVWIIQQSVHVTAACRENANSFYFYDNNIGCVECDSGDDLKAYVKWAADINDELAWENTPGVCVRCAAR